MSAYHVVRIPKDESFLNQMLIFSLVDDNDVVVAETQHIIPTEPRPTLTPSPTSTPLPTRVPVPTIDPASITPPPTRSYTYPYPIGD
jgi:hypothetical protein